MQPTRERFQFPATHGQTGRHRAVSVHAGHGAVGRFSRGRHLRRDALAGCISNPQPAAGGSADRRLHPGSSPPRSRPGLGALRRRLVLGVVRHGNANIQVFPPANHNASSSHRLGWNGYLRERNVPLLWPPAARLRRFVPGANILAGCDAPPRVFPPCRVADQSSIPPLALRFTKMAHPLSAVGHVQRGASDGRHGCPCSVGPLVAPQPSGWATPFGPN